MKKIFALGIVITIMAAACGGGGGSGPTPTPTSDATKAVSSATTDETMPAVGEGAQNGLQHMTPTAMIVKDAISKAPYEGAIDTSHNCEGSGTIGVTGTLTAQCTGDESNWSCTSVNANMMLAFSECKRTVTIGSTTYAVTINGTATSTVTGSASGNASSMSASFECSLAGTPLITGDANGTIDLANFGFSGTVTEGSEPSVACSGTTTVTLDSVEQVCSVSSDCSTCTE